MSQSEKFWDRAASTYDREEKTDEPTYVRIVARTEKYLHANDIVLDYGCATGIIANEIAGHVKAVHGIDISSRMVEIASEKAAERQIENVAFAQTTIFDKRYESESFDVILAFNILHLLEDMQKAVQRINELLKPGGVFISATACMGERTFLNRLFRLALFPLSKVGIVPQIQTLRICELEESLVHARFQIVETEYLTQSPTSYFVAAKKI
jgi:2-polyprenyl-3-methyl-5-hydroxy-6-metoxy-1,4-benzoquinol methylase